MLDFKEQVIIVTGSGSPKGIGKTKKASEQAAAYEAIMKLREKDGE